MPSQEPCTDVWTGPQVEETICFCLLKERFQQKYIPYHYLITNQAEGDPMLELFDQEAFTLHPVKAHGVGAFAIVRPSSWKFP